MNYRFFLLVCALIFVMGCDTKKEPGPEEEIIPQDTVQSEPETNTRNAAAIQNSWESYYTSKLPAFSMNNFVKDDSYNVKLLQSSVKGMWEPGYNPVYKQFLAFNSDSTKYVDIDSYKWGFDDKNNLVIGPDQEIVLADVASKKVNRLLFYGPSFWVEDAYFKNDSTLILLENSTDRIPAYQEIDLKNMKATYYLYKDTVDFDSDYFSKRIQGIYTATP